MGKFNFDVVFSGTPEEQEWKTAHLIGGQKLLLRETERDYADAVLRGNEDRAISISSRLTELREFSIALGKDPRIEEIKQAVREREVEKASKNLVQELTNYLTRS